MLLKTKSKSTANAEARRRGDDRVIRRSGDPVIGARAACPRHRRRAGGATVWIVLLVLLSGGLAFAQAQARRLILKDGSYQIATKWEIKGDRVRYYSAERYDWEEIPTELVDWKATEDWAKQHGAAVSEAAAAQVAADKEEEELASPTVAPGLRLPDTGGIFLLDVFRQKPSLVELVQNGTKINKQTGKNILRAVINPLPTGPKQTIELKGAKARVQSHEAVPAIYVNINYDDDSATGGEESVQVNKEDRFKIVRLKKEKAKRVVADLKINLLGGQKEQRNVVLTRVETVGTDWVKVTPVKPLEPGEYALVEMLTPKQMNLYVWDFGVDPNAPANPTAWRPARPKSIPTVTNESPVLGTRPKK
jgi:hypothetical protein